MDNVNHPSHYNIEGKKECIEQMREDYGETITAVFCLTNAYKYLYRAGYKGDMQEDIAKAKWYFGYFCGIKHTIVYNSKISKLELYIAKELKKYDKG